MLHIQSTNFLRRQAFCISNFGWTRWWSNGAMTRGVSYLPPCLNRHDPLAQSEFLFHILYFHNNVIVFVLFMAENAQFRYFFLKQLKVRLILNSNVRCI